MGSSWHTAAIYLWERNIMNRIAAVVAGLSLAFTGTSTTFAATINVPADQPTIAAAISASATGDVINIAAGTYNEYNLNPGGKAITIQGTLSEGSLATTIDANQSGSVFVLSSGESTSTVIQNLNITGASSTGGSSGGSYGGGIFCNGSSPTILNCIISGNQTNGGIGGGNFAGGITCVGNSGPTITNCTIASNTAIGSSGGGFFAGGICLINEFGSQTLEPTISNCVIENNSATSGSGGGGFAGGIYISGPAPSITGCTISSNTASGGGASVAGAIGGQPGFGPSSGPTSLANCTFTNNTPGNIIGDFILVTNNGACCYDGLCWSISQEECSLVGGTFLAETCSADTACPTPCSSDVDNDGDIDIQDLLQMLTDWGSCP